MAAHRIAGPQRVAPRAARHLGVSQPITAAQIRQFEQAYGAELFYRSGRKLEVTETGIKLLPVIEKMIDLEVQE